MVRKICFLLLGLLMLAALFMTTATYGAPYDREGLTFPYKWEIAATPTARTLTYNGNGGNDPTTNQILIAEVDQDGASYNNLALFQKVKPGSFITINDSTLNSYGIYQVTGTPTDSGLYWTFPVAPVIQKEFWALSTATALNVTFDNVADDTTVTPSTGVTLWGTNGFRLTLTNGNPLDESDVVGASTLYWTPYTSDAIALYNGSSWVIRNISQRSLALSGLTANKNYDVFVYDNAGTPTLELGPAWTSDTVRATNIVRLNGVFVKSGTPTRRYVGSIRATSATTTESSNTNRFVYNYSNPLPTQMYAVGSFTHTYTSSTSRLWGNSDTYATSRVLIGVGSERILLGSGGTYGYSSPTGDARIFLSIDTAPNTFVLEAESTLVQSNQATWTWVEGSRKRLPQGVVYIQLSQRFFGSGSPIYGWFVRNFTVEI